MSDAAIRKALETRLNALTPEISTAWENVDFAPQQGVPYQKFNLLRAEPENPEQTGTFKRFLGVMQVSLYFPRSTGPGAAEARGELLRAHFPRGLALTKDGVTVQVDRTPYMMSGFNEGDRYVVPVRVPYFANVGV